MKAAKTHLLFPLLMILLVVFSCPSAADPADPFGGTGGGPISGTVQVRVVWDGSTDPVSGAFVMVGPRPGDPFPGNWGFATAQGEISFVDPALEGPVTITAAADGARAISLLSVDASDLVLPLRPLAPDGPNYEIGDFVSGIDVDNGPFHAGDGNVDLAVVLPSLVLSDLLSFNPASLFGPLEIVEVLGEQIEVPSNVFIPQQWELFIEVSKAHYSLFLPGGERTLTALAGRIPVEALLGGAGIPDLLPEFEWRETDRLDWNVTGDTDAADLFVDPDLITTASLTVGNLPDGSTTYCVSGGDLDGLAGRGRLVAQGLTSIDCPAGSGPCGGSVGLTTTAAVGEFAGMTYFPMAAAQKADSDDLLVIIDRADRPRDYALVLDTFYDWLDLGFGDGGFFWNDVESAGNGSPDVDLQIARIADPGTDAVLWEFLLPGDLLSFVPPILPTEAPAGLMEATEYRWNQMSLGLGTEHPFDFDEFAFAEIITHGSHAALDQLGFVFNHPPASVASTLDDASRFDLTAQPNPFREEVGIAFRLPDAAAATVKIVSVDGRAIATLAEGNLDAGAHRFFWSGRDEMGRRLASGLYLVRIELPDRTASRPILLLH